MSKLYVGGLSYATTNESLQALFETVGKVQSATVIMDRDTGRSKGFGFVEMTSTEESTNAITKLNGSDFDGRKVTVSEARERAPRQQPSNRW